ncbi:MAG: hypothetical protein KUA37_07145 [Desulfomicrobium sp.]|nr:hypothetical protein [Pseudomonadota bacterium]MBV1711767.1 hypothetical protein [Desulfomicrobium sp.]MBU4572645.1 hypothetical protein [Pseudomonadota bacterium]MBU4593574.1 hypothetical protein [Pseudomonadota bacterium]MBV1719171.1 hypothetical protein [Desulfomicrobium sp.]
MNRSTIGRVEKLEQQQAEPGRWIEWEDEDGTIVLFDGRMTHEEALKLLD